MNWHEEYICSYSSAVLSEKDRRLYQQIRSRAVNPAYIPGPDINTVLESSGARLAVMLEKSSLGSTLSAARERRGEMGEGGIYERVIDPPQMELTPGSGVWLGQHSHKHGLFKGIIQDVKLIFAPNGYITQCPNLNRTCPTCSDFLSLVQGIMDLQELLAKMTLKLNYAESRLTQLEGCHCERTCSANGLVYRDKELWVEPENCRNCACKNGVVECRRIFCPPANCSEDSLPVHVDGTCCKKCRPKCTYMGQTFSEGQRFLSRSCRECKNGLMVKVTETCPELNCTISEQILPDGRCCNVCRGYDFCAEGLICGENSECKNRNTKAECECKSGYASIHGDSTYCEGRTFFFFYPAQAEAKLL
ncbi:hypothetical protein L3Q82_008563 [Scortum barcoo]|uniref:Uncharacterized protein n=1 Tax=Scortum barcoo TaxID=214431 RepID=A0ACB8XBG8_9TELE|nr:hypothetical protein L3Q82_008563 [Scortum barcoo]